MGICSLCLSLSNFTVSLGNDRCVYVLVCECESAPLPPTEHMALLAADKQTHSLWALLKPYFHP